MHFISVIVPIYYGKKYINRLLSNVEKARSFLNEDETVEIILVNDAPDDPIEEKYISDCVQVIVLNTDTNRGIHGARVLGLSYAQGEYVVFLDQDDAINERFFISQSEKIGQGDAVVCRLINGNKLQYTETYRFEDVVTKDFMINNWNSIVSPGQVLIKKSSIPNIWKENIIKNNGADDYFLWLCMFAEGKMIVLNQDVLFEHIVTGSNTSGNTNMMMDSENEMIQILFKYHVFDQEDEECLKKLPDSLRREHVRELDTFRNAYSVYDRWLRQKLIGNDPLEIFWTAGIETVAIYGAGYIGKSIFALLKNSTIRVEFYIDANARYIDLDEPVYTIENSPKDIGAIIISLYTDIDNIKRKLKTKFNCPIYTIREIISEHI